MSNGTLDKTFGKAGIVKTDIGTHEVILGMALYIDGRILVTGQSGATGLSSRILTARYLATGALDSTFGSGGKAIYTIPNVAVKGARVALHSGGILVGANSNVSASRPDLLLAKYTANGQRLDSTFGIGGITTLYIPVFTSFNLTSLAIWNLVNNGLSIVDHHSLVARLNPDAELDSNGNPLDMTFNLCGYSGYGEGALSGSVTSVLIQPDGKIVASGNVAPGAIAVVRYLPDGALDLGF